MGNDRSSIAVPPAVAEELRRRLAERVDELRRQVAGAPAREEELRADCFLDAADASSATEALARQLSETESARVLLARAEAALARLDNGGYGFCLRCGEVIEGERLEAEAPRVSRTGF